MVARSDGPETPSDYGRVFHKSRGPEVDNAPDGTYAPYLARTRRQRRRVNGFRSGLWSRELC